MWNSNAAWQVGFYLSSCFSSCPHAVAAGAGGSANPPSPTVTTSVATPAVDNAVVSGDVNPNGLATTAWFEYGQENTLSTFTKTADQAIGSGTASRSVVATVTGLSAGTTYYYRVVAQNPAGTSKGTINSFSAALLPPTVSTSAANPVSNDNAVLNGDVNPNGLGTTAWFEWGIDPTLNVRNITSNDNVGTGAASVTIHSLLTNLTPGTTYYFRVAAQNPEGTSKGTIRNFKASQIPSATTNPATSVTSIGATLNGGVNPNGLQTNYWFVWGTDPNLTNLVLTSTTLPAGNTGRNVHYPDRSMRCFPVSAQERPIISVWWRVMGQGSSRGQYLILRRPSPQR